MQKTDGDPIFEKHQKDVFSIWNNFAVSDKLGLILGIIHQGESHYHEDGTAPPCFLNILVLMLVLSYLLSENTRFQVNVENLTDELYFPHSHSTHQASVGAPIHATFGITSSF